MPEAQPQPRQRERTTASATTYAIGDRVVICAKDHPWYGEAGVIEATTNMPGFDWVVKLNGAYTPSCGVSGREIRHV